MAGELEHVVRAAALRGRRRQFLGEHVRRRSPELAVAAVADAVRTLLGDLMPEVFGDVSVAAFAGEFVAPCGPDDFGDVCVLVQSLQFVTMLGKRVEKAWLGKAVSEL